MNQKTALITGSDQKSGGILKSLAADASGMYQRGPAAGVETSIEAPLRVGLSIAFVVFGLFGVWSFIAPIEGAAHAQGLITPRSYKTPIQHLEGGIVKEVHVLNGDFVEANEVLMTLDPTRPQSELDIVRSKRLALLALEARLIAERGNLDSITYPAELLESGPRGEAEMEAQRQVFAARKASRESAIAILNQRIGQLEARMEGLTAQRESKLQLSASFEEELATVRTLLDDGFESKLRLRELERSYAALTGEAAELAAQKAAIEIQIGETKLEIIQTQNTHQNEVAGQLAQTQTELETTREQITALTYIVQRTEVRASQAGIVNGLRVHTPGSVIDPGAILAEIVPQNDELVIDARVSVTDRDRIKEGQEASIRLPTFNAKSTPSFYGHVLNVSADAMTDPNSGVSYYTARIIVDEESKEQLGDLALVPGMPAEVFISTGSRTFLQYLVKPLTDSWARAFRED